VGQLRRQAGAKSDTEALAVLADRNATDSPQLPMFAGKVWLQGDVAMANDVLL
jgi:hypothetical protein